MLTEKQLNSRMRGSWTPEQKLYHFIYNCRKIHGDRYDYSGTVITHSRDKVQVNCPEHGPFWVRTDNHRAGKGCPHCANRRHDIFYFWRLGNTDTYKFGITKRSLGTGRIYGVAHTHNVEPYILRYYSTNSAATLERTIKNTFPQYRADVTGDGYTEMLTLNKTQLDEVLRLIDTQYAALSA